MVADVEFAEVIIADCIILSYTELFWEKWGGHSLEKNGSIKRCLCRHTYHKPSFFKILNLSDTFHF